MELVWRAGDWQAMPLPPQGQTGLLGVNAAPDAANRLAVGLLSHDGAGHQLKMDKAAAGDTGSLLFQTGWSGRAEMGCAGSDAFSVKVSEDGASWRTALRFDAATGRAHAPQGARVDGALFETGAGAGGPICGSPMARRSAGTR